MQEKILKMQLPTFIFGISPLCCYLYEGVFYQKNCAVNFFLVSDPCSLRLSCRTHAIEKPAQVIRGPVFHAPFYTSCATVKRALLLSDY